MINFNLEKLKEKYLIIDNTFKWIKETTIGKFILEKILFRSKSFYSVSSTLIFILISQLSTLKYAEELALKIQEQIDTSEGFINILWHVASFFSPSGNIYIIFILLCVIPIIFWLRSKELNLMAKPPKRGWSPYENWAYASGGLEEEYIISDKTVIYNEKNEKRPLLDGLNELRKKLLKEKSAIRLVGLSGVGKTRFVQAIFDERIGENIPEASLVYYTDMSRNPDPSPIVMIEELLEAEDRSIMIVDNCPPDLHRELVNSVGKDKSKVSLLTVEYDVREDLPEETDVFKLEPNSLEVIENIIQNRFDYINQIDARSIANFSGGNARIAIALANTIKRSETLTGLNDEELFKRLFQQRNTSDKNLIQSAEVLSLVYSFNGKDTDNSSELAFLAEMIGKNVLELYRNVEELKRRDLIQTRGDWRAVLPHAISNRLAKKALESMPTDYIVNKFLESGADRLIKSFVHRLSFLHDSEAAISIAEEWLAEDGWLGESKCDFNELGMDAFKNIASVSPIKALECIERAAKENSDNFLDPKVNRKSIEFVNLLRHIAYDIEYFDRAVWVICQFVVFEKIEGKNNTIEEVLKSLFWLTLSGTNALAEQRIKTVSKLLESEDNIEQQIGISILSASLQTGSFSAGSDFDFGARSRGLGWHPETNLDITHWYELYIELCSEIALSNGSLSKQARKLLSDEFRGLWNDSGNFNLLVDVMKKLHDDKPWIEGWFAVREAIKFDEDRYEQGIKDKIIELKEYLEPNSIYEKSKVFIVSGQNALSDYYLEDSPEERKEREEQLNKKCFECGVELAKNEEVLFSLMEEIICSDNYMLHMLLKGVLSGYNNNKKFWSLYYDIYKKVSSCDKKLNDTKAILSYFANNDLDYFNELMDNLVSDEIFGKNFPWLQTVYVDNDSLKRLHEALDVGIAPMWQYKSFAYGRNHENISDDDLADLIEHMTSKDEGVDAGIEILSMRFHGSTTSDYSSSLIKMAYKVLGLHNYNKDDSSGSKDYNLETILKTCINNLYDKTYAEVICKALSKGIKTSRVSDYHKFLQLLSASYPTQFLEVIFDDDFIDNYNSWSWDFSYSHKENYSIIDNIPSEEIIKWCDENPEKRYPFITKVIYLLTAYEDSLIIKPIIYDLINNTPILEAFLSELGNSIEPQMWSGSRADVIEKRLVLFIELKNHDNDIVKKWANDEYRKYIKIVKETRKHEQERNENRYERFE